jgi:hypothetical protein
VPPDAAQARGAVDDREEILGRCRAENLEVHVHGRQLRLGLKGEYAPVVMTAPADISVNGAPTFHVNFANTFDWNQLSLSA